MLPCSPALWQARKHTLGDVSLTLSLLGEGHRATTERVILHMSLPLRDLPSGLGVPLPHLPPPCLEMRCLELSPHPKSPFRNRRRFYHVPEAEGGHGGTSGDIPPLVSWTAPSHSGQGLWGRAQVRMGQERARPCLLNARGLLARQEADPVFLPSILLPDHRRAGTAGTPWASQRLGVGPGSGREHRAATQKSPVIAVWKSF